MQYYQYYKYQFYHIPVQILGFSVIWQVYNPYRGRDQEKTRHPDKKVYALVMKQGNRPLFLRGPSYSYFLDLLLCTTHFVTYYTLPTRVHVTAHYKQKTIVLSCIGKHSKPSRGSIPHTTPHIPDTRYPVSLIKKKVYKMYIKWWTGYLFFLSLFFFIFF